MYDSLSLAPEIVDILCCNLLLASELFDEVHVMQCCMFWEVGGVMVSQLR